MVDIWGLPGPAGFLDGVERSLRDGTNVVVRFPRRMTPGFDDAIQERCDLAEWTVFRPDDACGPCESLLGRFAIRGSSLADLCESERFRGRLIWIEGLDSRNWPSCREFLTAYAQYSRNIARLDRTQFLAILVGTPPEAPPARDVTLEVHDWRGTVNEMDLLFLAYRRMETRRVNDAMRMLLATIVARVAAWDLEIADRLIEVEDEEDLIDPTNALRGVAANEGWTRETPEDWALGTASGNGLVHAALASVTKPHELRRRIWSAHASVLLPIIDAQRFEILREHERRIVSQLKEDQDGRDLYNLEIGDLADIVRWSNPGRGLRRHVERLRSARNELAHLTPLRCETVRALVNA